MAKTKSGISLLCFAAANAALGASGYGQSGLTGSSSAVAVGGSDSLSGYQIVDLSPPGYRQSCATGIVGDRIAGWAIPESGLTTSRHAMLWSGPNHKPIDLSTAELEDSAGYAVAYTQAVGCGVSGASQPNTHAFLWNSNSPNLIDLNPSGFIMSVAEGVSGGRQIGYGLISTGVPHALLWNSSPQSVLDLNPWGFRWSFAYGIWSNSEAGYGRTLSGDTHALFWQSTRESAVDLNSKKIVESWAIGIARNQIVGYGEIIPNRDVHALLWIISPNAPTKSIDLNPQGFSSSAALATNGAEQVGRGMPVGSDEWHALLWGGNAMATDLSRYLPKGFIESQAVCIDGAGNIVGDAVDSQHRMHAIEWILWVSPLPR
ncbi:MAG TPA: hypothetical protein VMG59_00055 [Phycisphaerae bacterium]|nr:hypothetical protein [Phycisphaerae bacterium]